MGEPDRLIVKRLSDIIGELTSHGIGYKQVLLANDETRSKVTQIAKNKLPAGCIVEEHIHPSMNEHFFFIEGKGELIVNDARVDCSPGVFVLVPAKAIHSIKAFFDLYFMTFSVAID